MKTVPTPLAFAVWRAATTAGLRTALCRHDGMWHGFFHVTEPLDDAEAALAEPGAAMKQSLAP